MQIKFVKYALTLVEQMMIKMYVFSLCLGEVKVS